MKVGTKLLAVVLPPLVVLVAVAGLGARDRLNDAGDARTAEEYIALVDASQQVIAEMQRERMFSALYLTTDGSNGDALDVQQAATDTAVASYELAAAAIGESTPMFELTDRATKRTGNIGTFRTSTEAGTLDPIIANQWFSDTIGDHLNLATAVADAVPVIEVSADLSSYGAISRVQEAQAKRAAVYTIALGRGEFDENGQLWRDDRSATAEFQRYESLFFDIARSAQSAELRGAEASAAYTAGQRFLDTVFDEVAVTVNLFGDGTPVVSPMQLTPRLLERIVDVPDGASAGPKLWNQLAVGQLDALAVPGDALLEGVAVVVSDVRADAEQQALIYLAVIAVAVIGPGVLAVVVARRITKPLRGLTEAADRLSTEQLPALVERLKSPSATGGSIILEPINMQRTDEIGQLADAFDTIQRVTVEVAEEQANLLKKGIGDIFVNLARRNQTLLDRQIEFIDQLESAEEDPDVLEDLFKLDHLATRMRRNAESLLVLAGIETGHRRSRPVPLPDVVRVAVGEVEDFARLNLVSMDDAVVAGTAAMDVAHLLSELMENATAYSPPETKVEVLGHLNNDGTYVLSVSDQGIGMSDEQFAEANKLLADPPLVGLTLSRSLGFTVVARLAARFNIDVRLTSSPTGGVTALVTLPTPILQAATISVEGDSPAELAPLAMAAIEAPVAPSAPVAPEVAEPANDWVADAPVPSTLATAVPEGAAFDAGLAALMGEETDTVDEPASAAHEEAAPVQMAEAVAEAPARTSSGLVKRVPRATGSVAEVSERPADDASVARTQRSPEEVRAMLSRYRSGLHRGQADSPAGSADESN
ncbi:MAG: nitrate- and nitrite sensing domain-containing protein [Acidimicrobiia bacterium]|nr:nitrate- and nitrite sensing domain-containing protein [Acidimicrobiia bacterium]